MRTLTLAASLMTSTKEAAMLMRIPVLTSHKDVSRNVNYAGVVISPCAH